MVLILSCRCVGAGGLPSGAGGGREPEIAVGSLRPLLVASGEEGTCQHSRKPCE